MRIKLVKQKFSIQYKINTLKVDFVFILIFYILSFYDRLFSLSPLLPSFLRFFFFSFLSFLLCLSIVIVIGFVALEFHFS